MYSRVIKLVECDMEETNALLSTGKYVLIAVRNSSAEREFIYVLGKQRDK